MTGRHPIKAVVVHFDPVSKELCIASASELHLPANALEMVRVEQSDLDLSLIHI